MGLLDAHPQTGRRGLLRGTSCHARLRFQRRMASSMALRKVR